MKNENILIFHQLKGSEAKRLAYTINFINNHPLKPKKYSFKLTKNIDDATIQYGSTMTSPSLISIPQEDINKLALGLVTNQYKHNNTVIFSVESISKKSCYFFNNKKINFDIFNTIFFHISRYEEINAPTENIGPAGWLKERFHFLIKNKIAQIPVVDQLVTAFFEIISGQEINQQTTYSISHDVDILTRFSPGYKFIRSIGANLYYRRGFEDLRKSWDYFFKMYQNKVKDPYDYFEELLQKEKFWKEKKIYLMTGGNTKYDNKYKIEEAVNIINLAKQRGYKIGLHPSYNAGFKKERYAQEKNKLETVNKAPIIHNRQHWLRWDWKITPYLFEKNGIQTDSTLGYNQHLGFRAGTGFPYHLYDFKNEQAFSWKEYPMSLMESSAIHLANNTDQDLNGLMRDFILDNKTNTHIMMNFHNSNFDPLIQTGRDLRRFYEEELVALCHA